MPGLFSSPLSWFSASASHQLDLPTVQKQVRWGGVASDPDPCHSAPFHTLSHIRCLINALGIADFSQTKMSK